MLRHKIFGWLFGAYVVVNGVIDLTDAANEVLVMYLIELMTCLTCAGLYLWWWRKTGPATEVYQCVTLLFCGLSVRVGIETYVRWIYIAQGSIDYQALICSYMWRLRVIPESIALLYMASLVIGRLIAGRDEA